MMNTNRPRPGYAMSVQSFYATIGHPQGTPTANFAAFPLSIDRQSIDPDRDSGGQHQPPQLLGQQQQQQHQKNKQNRWNKQQYKQRQQQKELTQKVESLQEEMEAMKKQQEEKQEELEKLQKQLQDQQQPQQWPLVPRPPPYPVPLYLPGDPPQPAQCRPLLDNVKTNPFFAQRNFAIAKCPGCDQEMVTDRWRRTIKEKYCPCKV